MIVASLGNRDILKLQKTAFLCSRDIPASIVLKCYDWAIEQRDKGTCVISGFHSQIEKVVIGYASKDGMLANLILEIDEKKLNKI
jgi:hypothetical protein